MAIMDHFGYPTQPLQDFNDPLWFNIEDFKPWLDHIKDSTRLSMIKDPAAEPTSINKKIQVDLIKSHPSGSEEVGTSKHRDGRPEKKAKQTKRAKLASPDSKYLSAPKAC